MCLTLISLEVFFQDQILGMFLHLEPNRLEVFSVFFLGADVFVVVSLLCL